MKIFVFLSKISNENNISNIKIYQWYFESFEITILIHINYIFTFINSLNVSSCDKILKIDFTLL